MSSVQALLQHLRAQPDLPRVHCSIDAALALLSGATLTGETGPEADLLAALASHTAARQTSARDRADDTIESLWTAGAPVEEIAAALGNPGMDARRIYRRARRLGLPHRDPVRSAAAREQAAARMRAQFSRWTNERDDALRAGWANGDSVEKLRDAISALPGTPFASTAAVYERARTLKLPKRNLHAQRSAATMEALRARKTAERVWTEERIALLIARATEPKRELLPALNALPGPPIRSIASVVTMRYMLRCQGRLLPAAPEPAATPEPEPKAPAAGRPPSPSKTEARVDLLRALWLDPAVSADDLFERINALPGPPVPHKTRLYDWARDAGLTVPRPVTLQRAPTPPPRPAPVAPPPPPAISPREQARAALREGRSEPVILNYIAITPAELAEVIAEEAALADQRADKRRERARRLIADGASNESITASTRLPLRDVFRLRAELREAGRAAS